MVSGLKERLSALLVDQKILTQEKLNEALVIQKEKKERIGDILMKLGYIVRENLVDVLSAELNVPAVRITKAKIPLDILKFIPKKIAELYCVLPLSVTAEALTVAMADPMNVNALDDIRRVSGKMIRTMISGEKEIRESIELYYGENVSQSIKDVMRDMASDESIELQDGSQQEGDNAMDLLRLTEDEPVVKLTNSILGEAVKRRSSDIFIEP